MFNVAFTFLIRFCFGINDIFCLKDHAIEFCDHIINQ